MPLVTKAAYFLFLALFMLALLPSQGQALAAGGAAPDARTIADAYFYLLGRALVIRQERTDLKEPGVDYNRIKYNPLGDANFVNPNLDVAYLEAWFAVDENSAVLLDVPEITGRYYTAQLLDEWGEVIANINERTFPSKPFGRFALVAPGSRLKLPADVGRIELHSRKAKLLARIELKGDPDGALALQKRFKASVIGTPLIEPAPALADFDNKALIGVELFQQANAILDSALDVAPNAAQMQQQVRFVSAYVASGAEARKAVDDLLRGKVIPAYFEHMYARGTESHGRWAGGRKTGNYGADFYRRTTINLRGIWANTSEEAAYFATLDDSEGKPLDGARSYVIRFPVDDLPDRLAEAYWSIILVSVPDYRVIENSLRRYNLNNLSGLVKDADGGMRLAIGPTPVDGVPASNWLPSAPGKRYSLTLRLYVPKPAALEGGWSPPPVLPVP